MDYLFLFAVSVIDIQSLQLPLKPNNGKVFDTRSAYV